MKNSNDTIGNRTRDLPTCSAVPQPTALPRALTVDTVATVINVYMVVFLFNTVIYVFLLCLCILIVC